MAEHPTVNRQVAGSSPAAGASFCAALNFVSLRGIVLSCSVADKSVEKLKV